MNAWTAVVLCVLIICATSIARVIIECAAKAAEAIELANARNKVSEQIHARELREHIRELDRALTSILLANPALLESLPDGSRMKASLRGKTA